jgi:L-asparaginase II
MILSPAGPIPATSFQTTALAHVLRSGKLESVHRGSIAVADARGRLVAQAGDSEMPVFWRSAAKLHQAIPLAQAGGIEHWELSAAQVAVICGSHNGEPEQVECVSSILRRLGLGPAALRCGSHEPYGRDAAHELIRRGQDPSPLHNTCSGNHAGLLALGALLGGDVAPYDQITSRVQQRALATIATFTDLHASEIFTGIDGCGIPAYRTPLRALAVAFARLLTVPAEWSGGLRRATTRVVGAVMEHPEFVSGNGELDTELIRAFRGFGLCKLGAEAVGAAAFTGTGRFPHGLGIAIKIEDGMGNRARAVALAECLAQLDVGTPEQRSAFDRFVERTVKTRRGEVVGEIKPAFRLEFTNQEE